MPLICKKRSRNTQRSGSGEGDGVQRAETKEVGIEMDEEEITLVSKEV